MPRKGSMCSGRATDGADGPWTSKPISRAGTLCVLIYPYMLQCLFSLAVVESGDVSTVVAGFTCERALMCLAGYTGGPRPADPVIDQSSEAFSLEHSHPIPRAIPSTVDQIGGFSSEAICFHCYINRLATYIGKSVCDV